MIDMPVHDREGKVVETIQFDESCLGEEVHMELLHQAVVRHEANQRVGTHKTKSRREVVGAGGKPWRQKGTGRARAGHKRSPLWRGGGMTHAIMPRDYRQGMSSRMRRNALKSALLAKFRDGEVKVVTDLAFDAPQTKAMANILKALEVPTGCLIVLDIPNDITWKSARNLPGVDMSPLSDMNAYGTLRRKTVLMTKVAIEKLAEEMK